MEGARRLCGLGVGHPCALKHKNRRKDASQRCTFHTKDYTLLSPPEQRSLPRQVYKLGTRGVRSARSRSALHHTFERRGTLVRRVAQKHSQCGYGGRKPQVVAAVFECGSGIHGGNLKENAFIAVRQFVSETHGQHLAPARAFWLTA